MAKIESILAECLDELDRGVSVEACLERHPEQREELEPLLRAAQRVRSTPQVRPSASFRQGARERMILQIRHRESIREREKESKRPTIFERLWPDLRLSRAVTRFAVPVMAAMVIIFLLGAMGVGAVYASSESLPGESLYPVKLAGERIRLALALSESRAARLHMRFASERLEEAAALIAGRGARDIEPLMRRYAEQVEAASGLVQRQRARGEDVGSLSSDLEGQLDRQQAVLGRVQEETPQEARAAVERALAASRKARDQVLDPGTPEPSPTTKPTSAPTATDTLEPTATLTPTDTREPEQRRKATETPMPERTWTPETSWQTRSPQAPGRTMTPWPPGQTMTPWPPGRTMTPQPPGWTITPQPPGQTKTPQPPGQTITPQPPGRTMTPQPPGQTMTPQPPGQTGTPGAP